MTEELNNIKSNLAILIADTIQNKAKLNVIHNDLITLKADVLNISKNDAFFKKEHDRIKEELKEEMDILLKKYDAGIQHLTNLTN